ncbi:hypothetical protein T02_1712, partial [Trichinella nativa]
LLDPGANLQTNLLGILIRYRRYRIGLQMDNQKMYLQVALNEKDRTVASLFWPDLLAVPGDADCSPACREATGGMHWGTLLNMYVDVLVVSCNSGCRALERHREEMCCGYGNQNIVNCILDGS